MADEDTIRRREIRKRKILEHSEARLNRITSAKKNQEVVEKVDKEENNSPGTNELDPNLHHQETIKNTKVDNSASESSFACGVDRSKSRINFDGNSSTGFSNGSVQRSPSSDSYIFPKKVSDAETRSFGRSRCDARRNSTCTQMMMETFQFSSFSFALLRPWIAAILSITLKVYFLLFGNFPFFQNLLLHFFLMEIAFFSWTKFESQANSRQFISSFIPGILLLLGIPTHVVTGFSSILYLISSALQDLAVYMFSFVFLHFICEIYM